MKLFVCVLSAAVYAVAQSFPGAVQLDQAIDQAVSVDIMHGAVLLIGHDGRIVYQKAYGRKAPDAATRAYDARYRSSTAPR